LYTRRLYESVGDYDPELFLVEDYDYFLRAASRFRFCHLGEPLYYFRRDDATLYCSRFRRSRRPTCWPDSRMARSIPTPPPRPSSICCSSTWRPQGCRLARALAIRQRVSYRLGAWLVARGRAGLKSRLACEIAPLFARYQSSQSSFGDTRAALLEIIKAHGALATSSQDLKPMFQAVQIPPEIPMHTRKLYWRSLTAFKDFASYVDDKLKPFYCPLQQKRNHGIYAINMDAKIGLFAQLNQCLRIFAHCERHGLKPIIFLSSPFYVKAKGENWLEYFFENRKLDENDRKLVGNGSIKFSHVSDVDQLGLPTNFA